MIDKLKELGGKIETIKEKLLTEEATKNALVMPFIQILGYDIFNPLEVIPEFTSDIGTKKGEKVDYAICLNGNPILIIECKHWQEDLTSHKSQLYRYFGVSKSKFAILTNGVKYMFFSDTNESNKMDATPFLEINLEKLNQTNIKELSKFEKNNFDADIISSTANDLKYTNSILDEFKKELETPSVDFIKMFATRVFSSPLTAKRLEMFKGYVGKAIKQYINQEINDRLNSALNKQKEKQDEMEVTVPISDKVTTDVELEGFGIIKAICSERTKPSKITYRDAKSYFAVLYEDNNRKPICRLHFNNENNLRIELMGEVSEKKELESVEDIFSHKNEILKIVDTYIE